MWHAQIGHSMHYVDCDLPPAGRPKQGFAMPEDISVRRAQPAAAVAYKYAQLLRVPTKYRGGIHGCHICGALNAPEWCHTCERNKTPVSAAWPHLRPPYCKPCKELDLACRVCKTVPSTGPTDLDMARDIMPPGWEPGQDGPTVMQVAGFR